MVEDEASEQARKEARVKMAAAAAAPAAPEIVDLDGEDEDAEEMLQDDAPMGNPDFVTIPEGAKMPAGWIVTFVRIRGAHTNMPKGGDRWCALWNLTEGDEKLAMKRARGEAGRVIDEFAKQTIRLLGRVADPSKQVEGEGYMADWGGSLSTPGSVDRFWNEIGGKYRHVLKSIYLKNHTFDTKEHVRFFAQDVSPRSVG